MFQVRVREENPDTPPGLWREEIFPSANGPVTIDGLKLGIRYAFQARGHGVLGWTDWSDSLFFICT